MQKHNSDLGTGVDNQAQSKRQGQFSSFLHCCLEVHWTRQDFLILKGNWFQETLTYLQQISPLEKCATEKNLASKRQIFTTVTEMKAASLD